MVHYSSTTLFIVLLSCLLQTELCPACAHFLTNNIMSSSSSSLKGAIEDGISLILKSNFLVDSQKVCILTLLKIITTILNQPNVEKVRKLRLSNKTIQSKIVEPQGTQLLLVIGFLQVLEPAKTPGEPTEQALFLPPHSPLEPLHQARHQLQQLAIYQLHCPPDSLPKYNPASSSGSAQQQQAPNNTNTNFNVYQGQRYDGKSAAMGTNLGPPSNWKSTTYQQLEQLQKKQAKLESKLQKDSSAGIDREWSATTKATASSMMTSTTAAATSNSSSKEDSALLAKQLQKQQQSIQQQQTGGFTTKAMRDLERLKKQKVYSHCQLAIQFPNGDVLRGNFLPKETIGHVLQSMIQNVFESLAPPPFDLYMTPPRTLLQPKETLQALGLVPAAKIYLSWKTAQTAALRPELFGVSSQGPSAPIAKALVEDKSNPEGNDDSKPSAAAAKKKKKTKAEKEAEMLKRMMGS